MPNYAAECAMKCEDRTFQRFLHDASKMRVNDKHEAAAAVRLLCKVESRKELNTKPEAIEKWKWVKRIFVLWQGGAGTNQKGGRYGPTTMGAMAFHRGTQISGNPFPKPALDETEETDFDLWEFGWRKAAREYAK